MAKVDEYPTLQYSENTCHPLLCTLCIGPSAKEDRCSLRRIDSAHDLGLRWLRILLYNIQIVSMIMYAWAFAKVDEGSSVHHLDIVILSDELSAKVPKLHVEHSTLPII